MEAKRKKKVGGYDRPLELVGSTHHGEKRGLVWFGAMTAVFGLLVWLAVIVANYLLALVLVLGLAVLYQLTNSPVEKVKLTIDDDGLVLGGQILPWRGLKTFWILPKGRDAGTLYIEKRNGGIVSFNWREKPALTVMVHMRGNLPERLQGFTPLPELINRLFKV